MKLELDKTANAAYLRFNGSSIVESEEVEPGIILDFDASEEVVGIEVLHFDNRTIEEFIPFFNMSETDTM